jgi:hypothetical protein
MIKPSGYILYQTSSYAVVATTTSANRKTGDMIQVWILTRDVSPVHAVSQGLDAVVCFDCKHRGDLGAGRKRSCYVNVGQAPNASWKAYQNGRYPFLPMAQYAEIFTGRKVRFGAYGDPVLIPLAIIRAIVTIAAGWTGYTHQWKTRKYREYSQYLMASVDSVSEYRKAKASGWRTFRVTSPNVSERAPQEIVCPAESKGIQCLNCTLCNGARKVDLRKDISITVHGTGAGNFAILQ